MACPRPILPLLFVAASIITTATAQVTGVPGINDYTLNGLVSGSTSCTPLCIPSPVPLTMTVNTAPGNGVMIFFTDCPCRSCAFPWPPNTCFPGIPPAPTPPCNGATNQSLDLFVAAPCVIIYSAFLVANAAGIASQTVLVPGFTTGPCGALFTTQAIVIDPCGNGGFPIGPGPFVMTQAYNIAF